MNSERGNKKNGKTKIGDRYWSVMLVGEHGQVVPFRRFKSLAVGVISALAVLLIVVAVLSILLFSRSSKIRALDTELKVSQQQLAELRDEKDLLLTQMVIKKKLNDSTMPKEDESAAAETEQDQTTATPTLPESILKQTTAVKEETPEPSPPEPAKLSADARQIKVSYQSERQLLSLSFRIYNTSLPKVPLSGRSVVVFKKQDDPPIKWMAVPRVQLIDGKPSGKRGKAFKINNYRTLAFKAFKLKAPIRYNTATIFIYTADGELLMTKDHSFKVEALPAPKPIVPKPKPKPKPIEKKLPPKVTPSAPVQGTPDPTPIIPPAPDPSGKPGEAGSQTGTPSVSTVPSGTEPQVKPSESPTPSDASPSTPNIITEPDAANPSTQGEETSPPAETPPNPSQPLTQGDQQ